MSETVLAGPDTETLLGPSMAITVACCALVAPFVVNELFAQRRLTPEVLSTTATQSLVRLRSIVCSARLWGEVSVMRALLPRRRR